MQLHNKKTNEVVETSLSLPELAQTFADCTDQNHWLWFFMAQHVAAMKEAPARKDMIAFLADSFLLALGMGLKKPMIRLHWRDRRYKIYLSKKGTLCFKTGALIPGTHDPDGDEVYMGCLWQGRFLPNRDRSLPRENQEVLDRLSSDPSGFLALTSKDMGRCCYCNQPLDDPRSKQAGYGQVCAGRWGLPWGKEYDEKVPSFADVWGRASPSDQKSVRWVCQALRQTPRDELLWQAFGDALEELGYLRKPSMPAVGAVIPSA